MYLPNLDDPLDATAGGGESCEAVECLAANDLGAALAPPPEGPDAAAVGEGVESIACRIFL